MLHLLGILVFNRVLIITQDGCMGLGPSDSRAGGAVAVIFGEEVL